MNSLDTFNSLAVQKHSILLRESYERVCGKPFPLSLTERPLAEALYHSELILVSHGMEKDPIFNYANLSAQALWGMNWETFTRLPSRLSAKADKVKTREAALKEAFTKGYIEKYEGVRIDARGKEFYIKNVTLWNLMDATGVQHGQAAMFDQWEYL